MTDRTADQAMGLLLLSEDGGTEDVLRALLDSEGAQPCRIHRADGIAAAQSILDEHACEAAFFELQQDDRGDLDSLRCLLRLAPSLPVLALVREGGESHGETAVREGAADYLVTSRLDAGQLLRALLRHLVDRHRLKESLEHIMLTDELTGLCNRRGFLALLQQQLRLAERNRRDLAVVLVAIDGLDHIVGEHGAHAGEMALMESATVLRETFRASDVIARIGGNELAVVAIDVHPNSEPALLGRLRDRLLLRNAKNQRGFSLQFRTGIARHAHGQRADIHDLLTSAREAMKAPASAP
jgi:diguanylate cyclase (GGDEF)-like protein